MGWVILSMAKDPALLWYFGDWYSGTSLMTRFIKGCYIDLLHAQFNNGHLSLEEIKTCLGSDFGSSWPTLQKKFKTDDNGLFFNERLDYEKTKRVNYCSSRRNNKKDKSEPPDSYDDRMENENENTTDTLVLKKESFRKEVYQAGELIYTRRMLDNFVGKWTEASRAKKPKMKFEKESTFEIPLRLKTWANNNFDNIICYLTDQEKSIKQKQHDFAISLQPYNESKKYPSELLNEFYKYWTMPENKPEPQFLRWELEEFWDLAQRLSTWRAGPFKAVLNSNK